MADTGSFVKDIAGPLDFTLLTGTGTNSDGTRYQMVPVDGNSSWDVVFSGTVRIASKDPSIAALADQFRKPLLRNLITLNSRTERRSSFFIMGGARPGRTVIVMEDSRGKPLGSILVAVKGLLHRTFMMHRYGDLNGATLLQANDMSSIMRMVKITYRNQANVLLDQHSDVQSLVLRKSYGQLIDFGPRTAPNGTKFDFHSDVVAELAKRNHLNAADIHVISTPQLLGTGGRTPGFGKICYIANVFDPRLEPQATTYAHEIGHAFGLEHSRHKFDDMMSEGNVVNHADSFIMTAEDIDAINKTDR